MTDDGDNQEAELLAEIERQWAEADRARSRVIRPARKTTWTSPLGFTFQVEIKRANKPF